MSTAINLMIPQLQQIQCYFDVYSLISLKWNLAKGIDIIYNIVAVSGKKMKNRLPLVEIISSTKHNIY